MIRRTLSALAFSLVLSACSIYSEDTSPDAGADAEVAADAFTPTDCPAVCIGAPTGICEQDCETCNAVCAIDVEACAACCAETPFAEAFSVCNAGGAL